LELKYIWSEISTTPSSDSSDWQLFNNGDEITQSDEGEWYLHVYVKNENGNEKYAYSDLFQVDITAPTVTFETNGNDAVAKEAATKVTVTDEGSGLVDETLKYAWSTSPAPPSDVDWKSFISGNTIEMSGVDG